MYMAGYKRKTAMTSRKVYCRKHSRKFKKKSDFCQKSKLQLEPKHTSISEHRVEKFNVHEYAEYKRVMRAKRTPQTLRRNQNEIGDTRKSMAHLRHLHLKLLHIFVIVI